MNTLDGGIVEFENGPTELPDAVAAVLTTNTPLVFVRNLLAHEVGSGIETRASLCAALGAETVDLALAAAREHWQSPTHPIIDDFKFDRSNWVKLGPHFDGGYLNLDPARTSPKVSVLGLAMQVLGDEPSHWSGKRFRGNRAARVHVVAGEPEGFTLHGDELRTGDGVLFRQDGNPTMHQVDFPEGIGRVASVWQLMARQ